MRLIDADQMALDESEAYMAAQVQIQDNVLRGINEIVHRKIQMLLADTPAVDAVPVVHGRWIEQEDPCGDPYYICSACKDDFYIEMTGAVEKDLFLYSYCPSCGAKMDGKDEDDV